MDDPRARGDVSHQLEERAAVEIAFANLDDVDPRVDRLVEERLERDDLIAGRARVRSYLPAIRDEVDARPRQRDHGLG